MGYTILITSKKINTWHILMIITILMLISASLFFTQSPDACVSCTHTTLVNQSSYTILAAPAQWKSTDATHAVPPTFSDDYLRTQIKKETAESLSPQETKKIELDAPTNNFAGFVIYIEELDRIGFLYSNSNDTNVFLQENDLRPLPVGIEIEFE